MSVNPIADARRGTKSIVDFKSTRMASSDQDQITDIAEIGKPCVYHESVDPNHRISNFFKTRMSIIDLIPCTYKVDFTSAIDDDSSASGLLPQIEYEDAISRYKNHCDHHGLPPRSAVRIFTTDDTQASDQFTNQLKENYFQSGINRISRMGDPLRDFFGSLDERAITDLVNELVRKPSQDKLEGATESLAGIAIDVIGKGHRISLPSIWSDSSYSPNFTTNVRLVSPYGDPRSIKEFVIKPLVYLLILSSPETADGVSYGKPFFLTLKGYGLSYSPLASIRSLTLRRGGNDTSFNVYRQPLSINVSMEFEYSVKGFAHHTHNSKHDMGVFQKSDLPQFLSKEKNDVSLPGVGHIIKSLQPRVPHNVEGHSNMKPARNTKGENNES